MKNLNWHVWLLVGALAGCARTNGESSADVGFELALTSGAGGTLTASEVEGGKLEITQARAVVERIELYLPTPVAAAGTDCEPEPGDDNPHCGDSRRRHGSGGGSGSDDSGHDDSRRGSDDGPGHDLGDDSRQGGDDDSSDDSVSGNGDKLTIRGPFIVDLVDGSSLPSIAQVAVPAGRYRRVDVRFSNDAQGKLGASDPLNGHTLIAEGTFTPNGGEPMPFSVALDWSEEARFESAQGFELDADGVSDFLLKLDISSWFAARPLAECIDAGVLAIDEKSSCDFGQDLKEAIKGSGRLEHR